MKFLECIAESTKSGKKFRNRTWSNDQYLIVKDNRIYRGIGGYNTSLVREKDLSRIGYDDWELVDDKIRISQIKDGERIYYNGYVYTKITIKSYDDIMMAHGILYPDNHVRSLPDDAIVERYKW